MNDTISRTLEWLTVFAYLAIALFVIWQVFTAKK